MLETPAFQYLVFAVGVLYLALHAGPLLRLWYEPSIRGGTRWQFFASEVVLFVGWWLAFPSLRASSLGMAVIVLHIVSHFSYFLADALAHEGLMRWALVRSQVSPPRWLAKELGLAVDTISHAVVVILAASALWPAGLVISSLAGLAGYGLVTRRYVRTAALSAGTGGRL